MELFQSRAADFRKIIKIFQKNIKLKIYEACLNKTFLLFCDGEILIVHFTCTNYSESTDVSRKRFAIYILIRLKGPISGSQSEMRNSPTVEKWTSEWVVQELKLWNIIF